jgi:hypothetical protein
MYSLELHHHLTQLSSTVSSNFSIETMRDRQLSDTPKKGRGA